MSAVAQGAGLNPQGVKVVDFTSNTAEYGQPITVTLGYTMNTDFLFGGLGTWTEQAKMSGFSFYVPGLTTGANGGCTPSGALTGSSGSSGSSDTPPASVLQITLQTLSSESFRQSYTASGVVNGGGIDLPNTLVTLSDGAQTLGSATTNNAGQYSITFTAPASGLYTYTATAHGAAAPATQLVTVKGWELSLQTAATETAGDFYTASGTITADGSGGASDSGKTVILSDGSKTLGSATTNSAGDYTVTFPAPASGTYTYTAQGGETTATQSVTVVSGCPSTATSGAITVSSASFSTGGFTLQPSTIVTVTGSNLPILASCDPGVQPGGSDNGFDYPNFLLTSAPPSVVQAGGGNGSYFGSTSMPYQGMWGVEVLHSSATKLQFTMPYGSSNNSGPWYFYFLPDGKTLTTSTPYLYVFPKPGIMSGPPTIPVFTSGTTFAYGWTVNGGANLYSAGSAGQPASFGGWVNGNGGTVTYSFKVLSGYDPTVAYGLEPSMYGNGGPVTLTLTGENGKTVSTSSADTGLLWEQALTPGTYTVSIQGGSYNIYGLWTNQPKGIESTNGLAGIVSGPPTIPVFVSGTTTLAPSWSLNGGASLDSAGSNGQPSSFGGWVNGNGGTVAYTFKVLPGYAPKVAYGLAQGMYLNNNAPVTVTLNGQTVATSYNTPGGTAQYNEMYWQQTLQPGTYTVAVQSSGYNVYGLWTNEPKDITADIPAN
jgi:plastocyanin